MDKDKDKEIDGWVDGWKHETNDDVQFWLFIK